MFDKEQLEELMEKTKAMQENIKKVQEDISLLKVCGESGSGLIKVFMMGNHDIAKITIDPSCLQDKEMLEDLITAAFNDANHKLEKKSTKQMSRIAAGIPEIPGLKLPF